MGCGSIKSNKKNQISQFEQITENVLNKDVMEFPNQEVSSKYSIIRKLGQGGFSQVYLCSCKQTIQQVALKVIKKDLDMKNAKKQDIPSKEVSIMRKLDHPYILKLFQAHEDFNTVYVSLEYASGGDLRKFLRRKSGLFNEKILAKVMYQVLMGLNYLHQKNIVHRDIKAENIYVVSEEGLHIKLGDFGYSDYKTTSKPFHEICGTTQYLAPEIFTKSYTEKVDLWSAGVLLFILSTGKTPYKVKNIDILMELIKTNPLSSTNSELRNYSPEFLSFISGLLEPDPKKRFSAQSALQHIWISSKIKKNSDSSTMISELKLANEENLFKKLIFLVASYLFVEESEIKKVRKYFTSIDCEFKGFIKKEDIVREFSKSLDDFNASSLAGKVFEKWDMDKDGIIQFTEFKSAFLVRNVVLSERNLVWVFEFFREDGRNFMYSKKVLEFLGFCFIGKCKKECYNLTVPEKVDFGEFKTLLNS